MSSTAVAAAAAVTAAVVFARYGSRPRALQCNLAAVALHVECATLVRVADRTLAPAPHPLPVDPLFQSHLGNKAGLGSSCAAIVLPPVQVLVELEWQKTPV